MGLALLVNLSDVKPVRVKEDVLKRTLLKPEQTFNHNSGLDLLELEEDAFLETLSPELEYSYYLLTGRGSLALPKLQGHSKWLIEPDTAFWVPCGKSHMISNAGEGPFRCLAAYCRARSASSGQVHVKRARNFEIHELVGFTSRSIYTGDALRSLGSTRTIGVDLETLSPKASLSTHEHEEEILYVLRGKGMVMVDAEEFLVRPGSMVYTGPHVPHSVHNTQDDIFQYLVWEFSP